MEIIKLGRSDMKVSRIGLGVWQFSGDAWGQISYEQAKTIVQKAFELGVNFFDTAAVYGRGRSEEFLGRSIKELKIRDSVYIATKVHGDWLRRIDIFNAVENQRRRLGVDAIDLYQIHWPACWHNTPICETMKTLEELIKRGLVRYIGVSNFPTPLLEYARSCLSRVDIITSQNRYNLIEREADKELLPYLKREGIVLIAWSPLAKGALSGKYTIENLPTFDDVRKNDPLFTPTNLSLISPLIQVLRQLSTKYNKTPAQIVLNWLIKDPWIYPIPGAKTIEQIIENVGAVGWSLSDDDWRTLDRLGWDISQKISYVTW
ncbi:MAG: aldo/keto reductase [Pyrobaculum sp.]